MKVGLLLSVSVIALGLPMWATNSLAGGLPNGFGKTPAKTLLYSQNSDYSGHTIPSDTFTSGSSSAYDSAAADDFVVPVGHEWEPREVDVTGTGLPASYENVYFYRDNNGTFQLFGECGELHGTLNQGSFAVDLPKGCPAQRLSAGRYWMSFTVVTANYWAWATRTNPVGHNARWENPRGGYNPHCETWERLHRCWSDDGHEDLMFSIKGIDRVTKRRIRTPALSN